MKATVYLPNKKFDEIVEKQLTVKITGIEDGSREVMFQLSIPSYIYEAVCDKHVEYVADGSIRAHAQPVVTYNRNKKMNRYVTSHTLHRVIEKLEKIGSDARVVRELEAMSKAEGVFGDKFLAVRFEGSEIREKDSYNFADLGTNQSVRFQWCRVYRFERQNWMSKETVYGFHSGQLHGAASGGASVGGRYRWFDNVGTTDPMNFRDGYTLIPWTDEREAFLMKLQHDFSALIETFNRFLRDLDETKLETLMNKSRTLKLLA